MIRCDFAYFPACSLDPVCLFGINIYKKLHFGVEYFSLGKIGFKFLLSLYSRSKINETSSSVLAVGSKETGLLLHILCYLYQKYI